MREEVNGLDTKAKKRVWLSGILGVVVLLILGVVIYFANDPWGFARQVSAEEREARLSVVEAAEAWLGASEANGSFREIIDLYNSHEPLAQDYTVTYTDSWCATFVSASAIVSGHTGIIPTECSCQRQIALFQELDCWEENDNYLPLPGDVIYYCWGRQPLFGDCTGWANHVGIVIGTAGPFIKVIEGNKDDQVAFRYIPRGYFQIRGYGLPDYGKSA